MRPDDSSIDEDTLGEIKQHVERALRDSGALGVLPTPIARIVEHAKLSVDPDVSLDDSFFSRLYKGAGGAIRRAVSKVLGLFDVKAKRIYLDRTAHKTRQVFVTLHETGHGTLPWQRDMYEYLEDCEHSLDLDLKEQFEREANVFASEMLFQGGRFDEEARDLPFSIKTPMALSKRFGASIYATLRRYVSTTDVPCALLVYEAPQYLIGKGQCAALHRAVHSRAFVSQFGPVEWPAHCTWLNFLSSLLFPRWRLRESVKCTVRFGDEELPCRFDAFNAGEFGYYVLAFPEFVRPPKRKRR